MARHESVKVVEQDRLEHWPQQSGRCDFVLVAARRIRLPRRYLLAQPEWPKPRLAQQTCGLCSYGQHSYGQYSYGRPSFQMPNETAQELCSSKADG